MHDADADDVQRLLRLGGRLVHGGMERAAFIDAFRQAAPAVAPSMFPADSQEVGRAAGAFAFALWRAMPSPRHGWRPPPAPLPGRNEPCFCGSGQKFKRCCAGIPVPAQLLQEVNLLLFVLDACTAKELGSLDLDRIDPIALGDVAAQWVDEGDPKRAAQLLEPMFRTPQRLDARHVDAFDALMSAWLVLDRPRKRKDLLDTLLRHPDAELSNAARQREVSMLADQCEWEAAWSRFRDLLRRTPDDPALAHLEIALLKGQERDDEATARAEFWSSRLRQLDPRLAGYADALLAMASDEGASFASEGASPAFVLLCEQLLQDSPPAEGAYAIREEGGVIELRPSREMERIEKAWCREFAVPEPILTSFTTDPEAVIDRIPAAIGFLDKHPLARQSFRVLDYLALVAHAMGAREPFIRSWVTLQRKLGERAERLLAFVLPPSLQPPHPEDGTAAARAEPREGPAVAGRSLPWAVHANRPALRLVALQIGAREQLRASDPRIEALMEWLLQLNPDDNHGYRSLLAQRLLRDSRPSDALALLERYPDDVGAALADRILALYLTDRPDDAAALLQREGRWVDEIVAALLAPKYRRPKELDDDGFITIGGRDEAWIYRNAMRSTWEGSGALRWLKEQRPRAKPGGASRKRRETAATDSQPLGKPAAGVPIEAARKRLVELGGDPVRIHGAILATAIAPDIGSPTGWIGRLLRPADGDAPAFRSTDDAQLVLDGITAWYNAIVMEVGPASFPGPRLGEHATPWLGERTSDAVSRWAAGFMNSVSAEPAAWAKLRPYPELLAPLRKLAAQAPLSPAERADPSLIRDRGDDAPLLAAVEDTDPVALLVEALERLAQRVGLLRQAANSGRR